jgi:DNA primase
MIDFRILNLQLPALDVIRSLHLVECGMGGGQWRGKCPYHESNNPHARSLAISLGLRKFLCHKCGAHGDLIDLSATVWRVSLVEAARRLAEEYGI